jgi:hypothetical protein
MILSDLPEDIKKEFTINELGQGFVSRRGTARMCGVTEGAIRKLLNILKDGAYQNTPKSLQSFIGTSFEGAYQLPDLLVAAIIKSYAYKGKEIAQDIDSILGAIGLRVYIQNSLGWSQPEKQVETSTTTKWMVERYLELGQLASDLLDENEALKAGNANLSAITPYLDMVNRSVNTTHALILQTKAIAENIKAYA